MAFLIVGCAALAACTQTPRSRGEVATPPAERRFEFERVLMGVPFRCVVYGADEEAVALAARAAFSRVRELNAVFSDYDPESEVRRLCAEAPSAPKKISADLARVLLLSRELWERSGGAFDPSVGPLVELWRRARRSGEMPPENELAAARARRGFDGIEVDAAAGTARFLRRDLALDFGAIAKGYAADAALALLREKGFPRALVGASGDIAVGDPPPGERGWRVAIESLEDPRRSAGELLLANAAVSTSGDAWQHVEIDGVRYAHIVDPATGVGLRDRFAATVVAPSCALSDALATALCVLGPDHGYALATRYARVDFSITRLLGGALEERRSRGFDALIAARGRDV